MKRTILVVTLALIASHIFAQNRNNIQMTEILNRGKRTHIAVPDILGYQTLKCDFHIHTVFSDGIVWPTVRVDEAWKEGLDVIAITDHIERSPGKQDMGGDDNSAYEIAAPKAAERNIILIHAGEITRSMPPGHFNALFLENTNDLDKQDWHEAFEAAKKQGAYIIWNHPGWKAQQPDTCLWWDEHTELYEKGMIHAIEVFNEKEWYPLALEWCIDKDLAVTAASDIHGIISEMYDLENYHRPMTLVLAKERSEEAVRDALFDNRTIAWFGNKLAGKEEYLKAFFEAAVKTEYLGKSKKGDRYLVSNLSDVPFHVAIKNGSSVTIPEQGEAVITVPGKNLSIEVKNLYVHGLKPLSFSYNLN